MNMLSNLMVLLVSFYGCIHLTTEEMQGDLPPPFDNSISFKRRPGVYIEKWEGIDSFKVSSLLKDSRFPYMPTYRTYGSMFTQPHNWGENYGSRIRAYFVPKVTGPHTFYLASDNEGQLWLSRDIWPEHKSKIAWIGRDHFTKPLHYTKYTTQKSWPVFLEKGQYYYMESLMKEYYDDDTFSVAVQLPGENNVPKGPIREEYLWTDIPRPYPNGNSFPDNATIYRVAAAAGAKAGLSSGLAAATSSAAVAGARAGRIAGLRAGAIAARVAAVAAARAAFAKTFNATFAAYSKHLHGLDVRLINNNGNVISRKVKPASIANGRHVYNVHVKHQANGQLSFTEPDSLPSYIPNANQGFTETVSSSPTVEPTSSSSVPPPSVSTNEFVIDPTSSPTSPTLAIDQGVEQNPVPTSNPHTNRMGPLPQSYPGQHPPSTGYLPNNPGGNPGMNRVKQPAVANEQNIEHVKGSSGQILRKIQYVKKPNYYKYFGPAKGFKQKLNFPATKAQSRQDVLRADATTNFPWPKPKFTPIESLNAESQPESRLKDNIENNVELLNSNYNKDDQGTRPGSKDGGDHTWPSPVFTPLETPQTDQNVLSNPPKTENTALTKPPQADHTALSNPLETDQRSITNPSKIDQVILRNPLQTDQRTFLQPLETDRGRVYHSHGIEDNTAYIDQHKKLESPENEQAKPGSFDNMNQDIVQADRKSISQANVWNMKTFDSSKNSERLNPLAVFLNSNHQGFKQSSVEYPTLQDDIGYFVGQNDQLSLGETGDLQQLQQQQNKEQQQQQLPYQQQPQQQQRQQKQQQLPYQQQQQQQQLQQQQQQLPYQQQQRQQAPNSNINNLSSESYPTPNFESLQGNFSKETAYNQTQSTREDETFVYYPKPGEDPDSMARKLVYEDGCASKIVFNAHYSIHSLDVPALQMNVTQNNCINSFIGEISLRPFCQYFIIREGLLPKTDSDDISLESACIPDHFLAQRNYRFYLLKRDGSMKFAREATFAFYKTISFPSSLQIMLYSHYLWFICESKHKEKSKTKVILEYIESKNDEFERCSFSFVPMPAGTNPHVNCKGVLNHRQPEIKGNHWIEDKHKEPVNAHGVYCLAINFINHAGRAFQVYSNIKNNRHLVTSNNLKIKTVIKRPDLHNHVTYKAEAVEGDGKILLNGLDSFTVLPQRTCNEFVPVKVTYKQVQPTVIQHNHYHYQVTQKCPALCSRPQPCQTTCPTHCCKRDKQPT